MHASSYGEGSHIQFTPMSKAASASEYVLTKDCKIPFVSFIVAI